MNKLKAEPYKFKREPSRAEMRHIVKNIWGMDIYYPRDEYESAKEYEEIWANEFYKDVMSVIRGDYSVIGFSANYIAEEWDDAAPAFMFYDTYLYCINKGIF